MADNNTYTVKNGKQGFLSKLASSFAAIPLGLAIIAFGCVILWNNEKKNVINIKDVKELRENIKDVKSDSVDSANEGKLIATSGTLDYGEVNMVDQTFGISLTTPILVRKVEMYEWVETSETKDDETTYTYNKEWSEKAVNSSDFKKPEGHQNPEYFPYKGEKYVADTLKIGAYTLSNAYKDQLSASTELLALEPVTTLPEGYAVNGKYITNTAEEGNPQIGDIRISYTYGVYTDASVLGKQEGSTVVAYTTAKNSSILKLASGVQTGNEMVNNIESGNKFMKWFMRIVGIILVCMGTSMLLSPLTTLIGAIPFLGKIVNGSLGVVSSFVGFAISLVVIGIAWLVYRPILGVALIVVSVGLIVLAKMYTSKKDDGKKEEVKTEENKEEN